MLKFRGVHPPISTTDSSPGYGRWGTLPPPVEGFASSSYFLQGGDHQISEHQEVGHIFWTNLPRFNLYVYIYISLYVFFSGSFPSPFLSTQCKMESAPILVSFSKARSTILWHLRGWRHELELRNSRNEQGVELLKITPSWWWNVKMAILAPGNEHIPLIPLKRVLLSRWFFPFS